MVSTYLLQLLYSFYSFYYNLIYKLLHKHYKILAKC